MIDKFSTDYLVTLADLDEDALYNLYSESISKLRSKDTSHQDRKIHTIRVMYVRSIISDKYGLKLRHRTQAFDDQLNNERLNRTFR